MKKKLSKADEFYDFLGLLSIMGLIVGLAWVFAGVIQ